MSFLNKAKAAAQDVADKAQKGIDDVQTNRELGTAYGDLGRKAYELASSGAISHPELEPLVQRISSLQSRTGADQPEQATGTTPPQSPG